jgi:hypothetical protein
MVAGPHREVTTVEVLVVHRQDQRHDEHAILPGRQVEEAGHHVRSLDDDAGALHRRPVEQGVQPHGDGRGLLPEPHDDGLARRWLAQDRPGLERGHVERGHQFA